ncbi:LacI family DNA-binding transcriptional regulator [Domibacillus robiginosus]|uniref:LacI family DNA-binding transcriptional regulator n=1 Tax=Domibacillus robiginosus TaxID=1071054 RepID=UPI00067C1209|nr:LacI family DNA-binding transcriptional regulator [Domibacillus robiginosus]
MPGMKEAAKQANILIATVSRVLSKPETVAKELLMGLVTKQELEKLQHVLENKLVPRNSCHKCSR